MVREFKLPDVGEGLTEAEIVDWAVEVGDTVSEDQPVAEVETDKAVVEVPSPVNGTVREILATAGELVPVGDVIITFDVEGEETEAAPMGEVADDAADAQADSGTDGSSMESERVFAAPSARRLARELDVDITTVAGSGPGGRVNEVDVRAATSNGEMSDESEEQPAKAAVKRVEGAPESKLNLNTNDAAASAPTNASSSGAEPAGREQTLAAPATRKLAEETGVNIDNVPTDQNHDGQPFVTPDHVHQYAEAQQLAQTANSQAVTQEARSTPPDGKDTPDAEVEQVPYQGIRRTIGKAMETSKYTAPHVTHQDTAVVDALVNTRTNLSPKAEKRGIKLTYMPFIIQSVIAALKEYPILNSQLNEADAEILVKQYHNIGIAVATDAGLMVPVIKNAGQKDLLTIASDVNELASKARDRSIARDEMQNGTFSITNFGAIGGEYATPIINYPETAILGLGELKQRPVVENGEVVAKHTVPISLSIDHRVIDGAEAAQFANTLIEYLENPEMLLLE
jgi:pyruvate dehydrogenase E2 component (dihydrolipoamide acetyltransferase)